MNILNNGRFGMAAALSGTMKGLIKKAVCTRMMLKHIKIYNLICNILNRLIFDLQSIISTFDYSKSCGRLTLYLNRCL